MLSHFFPKMKPASNPSRFNKAKIATKLRSNVDNSANNSSILSAEISVAVFRNFPNPALPVPMLRFIYFMRNDHLFYNFLWNK